MTPRELRVSLTLIMPKLKAMHVYMQKLCTRILDVLVTLLKNAASIHNKDHRTLRIASLRRVYKNHHSEASSLSGDVVLKGSF